MILRGVLVGATGAGIGAALWLGPAQTPIEADLVRLMRFMALLKGAFALAAIGLSWWRLAWPASAWREAVYVSGPALMAGGALALFQLQAAVLAAIFLHVGLIAFVAAALTDRDFIRLRRLPGRASLKA